MAEVQAWLQQAKAAAENSYCRYSGFAVGAALVCADGTVVRGCNVETATYNATCAERTAMCTAVAMGHRRFTDVAIVTPTSDSVWPCGLCRQILAEHCAGDFRIHSAPAGNTSAVQSRTLGQLLPNSFGRHTLLAATNAAQGSNTGGNS